MSATATAPFGEFSAYTVYTLEQLAEKCGRDRRWAYDAFIRPVNHKTKKRWLDAPEGEPIPGVKHARIGAMYFISGQSLMAWLSEWGDRIGQWEES